MSRVGLKDPWIGDAGSSDVVLVERPRWVGTVRVGSAGTASAHPHDRVDVIERDVLAHHAPGSIEEIQARVP